jgi:hypothetical protein
VLADRSIAGDAAVAAAATADAEATADAAARVLRRMTAADLGAVASMPADDRLAGRTARLSDAVLSITRPSPARDEVLARALVVARLHERALECSRRAARPRAATAPTCCWRSRSRSGAWAATPTWPRRSTSTTRWRARGCRGQPVVVALPGAPAAGPRPRAAVDLRHRPKVAAPEGRSTPHSGGPTFAAALLELAARHGNG